jgi:hypothetical protein
MTARGKPRTWAGEVLGRLADLSLSHAMFEAAVAKDPEKRICIRDRACVIRNGDRPQG